MQERKEWFITRRWNCNHWPHDNHSCLRVQFYIRKLEDQKNYSHRSLEVQSLNKSPAVELIRHRSSSGPQCQHINQEVHHGKLKVVNSFFSWTYDELDEFEMRVLDDIRLETIPPPFSNPKVLEANYELTEPITVYLGEKVVVNPEIYRT